jgi:adenylate cyclase
MQRKLAAILCADVHGYSRLMGEDEEGTLRTLSAYRNIMDSLIERHQGRFVNSAGDSVLAEFASVVEAVSCAVSIQTALRDENAELPLERRMQFRIGVNLGDVMIEGEQIYGDGVNVAARLESLADPGGLCISGTVYEQVRDKLVLSYEDRGEQAVKNITRPVRVWRVLLNGATLPPRKTRQIPRRYWRSSVLSLTGLAIVVATIVIIQHLSLKPPRTSASIPPHTNPALPLPSIPSIAVLPFTNLSGDPQQEYFSDGISNQLIEDLSRLPGLFVIARNSSFAYKGKTVNEHEIGMELGVKYLLEGSVLKTANRVRIGVDLADAATGEVMWTQRFDRYQTDIFAVQDEIVNKVVTTVGLLFQLEGLNVPRNLESFRPTDSLEAYDDFLRGLAYFVRQTKGDFETARRWFGEAVKLDPRFAQAYALTAMTYLLSVWNQWSENPQVDLERATELAHKALALEDSNSDAFYVLSLADLVLGRPEQAVTDGERAITLNPNSAEGYQALSGALCNELRSAECLKAAETSIRLNPAGEDLYGVMLGIAYDEMGSYRDAVAVLERTVAAYPNNQTARLALAMAYVELGRDRDAHLQAAEIMRLSPHFSVAATPQFKDDHYTEQVRSDWRRAGLK